MDIDLRERRALVTGGAIGIGLGIAVALAEAGADVAVTHHAHDAEAALEAIGRTGRRGVALPLDATDSAAVTAAVDEAARQLGGLDIVVNNAGGLIGRVDIAEMTDEHWHRVMDVNLSSTFYVSRAALQHLDQGGRIVNISSVAGQNGGSAGSAAYATSKAAVDGFTHALSREVGPRGITVNSIAPGLILDTPFHEQFTPRAAQEARIADTPVRRAGYPADVAGAVLYLVSDLGSFVTGAVIDVNGGTYFT